MSSNVALGSKNVYSYPMNALYRNLFLQMQTILPERIQKAYAQFLEEYKEFLQDSLHVNYLYARQSDLKTVEKRCSICQRLTDLKTSQLAPKFLSINVPFLDATHSIEISSCQRTECNEQIQAYQEKIKQHLGPFKIKAFDKTLELAGDHLSWNFESMRIAYHSKNDKIDVIVELSRRNLHLSYGKQQRFISLKEVIENNPHLNLQAAENELPNTVGGRFIKQYIQRDIEDSSVQPVVKVSVASAAVQVMCKRTTAFTFI